MKIKNLNNKNQFVMEASGKTYFQSYSSLMAVIDENGNLYVSMNTKNYSNTTAKYMKQFMAEHGKEYNRNKIFEEIAKNANKKIVVNDEALIEIK